ncbi:PREDICTED: interleukin-5 [Condylura cristata]|uniref:interleukin-5 n=1 Tax=Condylura cristata TaxID=143302 RepID=UPI0003343ED1|nr:PREDICTED: interleukin-5 [Condylura cristata]
MRALLCLSVLAFEAAMLCASPIENTMNGLVTETLILLSTHEMLLIGNETLSIPAPEHKNHQLCIQEVFQGIDTLKNQTVQGGAVEKLFQNLSLIKKHIDLQKKKCTGERWKAKKFLNYLQEILGVINTEWAMES